MEPRVSASYRVVGHGVMVSECGQLRLPTCEGVYLYDMSTIGRQSHKVHQQSLSAGGSQEAWVAYNVWFWSKKTLEN